MTSCSMHVVTLYGTGKLMLQSQSPSWIGRAHTDDSGQVSRGERHSAFGMYTRHSMHIWVVAKHRTTPAGQSVDEMYEDRQTETPSGGKKNHNTSNSC